MNLKKATKLLIYSSDFCPFCHKAEAFFRNNQLHFNRVDVLSDEGEQEVSKLKAKYGWPTIPMIFVNDTFIGGYSDMMKKLKSGELIV